jgi:BirA family biotin operon repressor/biotin-[acetyl-CoA-carboxylase] ligase
MEVKTPFTIGGLNTHLIGRKLFCYPSLTSTMDEAERLAKEGTPEGTVVIAEEQTAGRGRLGREWLSPKGNIALSIVLYPSLEQLTALNMIASLAVAHSIEKVAGLKAEVKWPNDVLINGRKVSGILVESALRGKVVDWAVVGIGVNIDLPSTSSPGAAIEATSLSQEVGQKGSPQEVLKTLLSEIERLYLAWQNGEPVYEEWREKLSTIGKEVRVRWGDEVVEGYAESVDERGQLILRRRDGSIIEIPAGEVTLRL